MIKGSIYKISHLHQLASRVLVARHGEQSFLPHWVCATSSWGGKTALARLPSDFTRHGELVASWWRANMPLCLFFPLLARHGELDCLGGE